MGVRSSKNKRNSYDIAPVVSTKDFTYKKAARPLPKIEIPDVSNQQTERTDEKPLTENPTLMATEKSNTDSIAEVQETKKLQDPRIPNWVNENNFKNMLLKTYPNLKDIIDFNAFPAMAAGENYATLMLRVKITAKFENDTLKEFSFMLKVPHDTKEMKDMMQAMNFFVTENTVYGEVMPEIEEMYRQAGVKVKLAPNFYRLELEDSNIFYVLLEDLSVDGFKNANRLECLNMEHTLSVLRKMAQFHAATACRVAKKGPYPAVFSPDMDNEMARAMLHLMFTSFKQPFLENLKTYKNGEKYYDLMDHFFDNLMELFVRSRKLLPGYFSVLNHGDSWSNNILFRYNDDGQLIDTVYVDFQNSNWGSPALDLYYFIISSVQLDIKLSQFDYFIRYYHQHLAQNLKLLEFPLEIPSLKDFHIELTDFGSMATMTSFLSLGIVLLDPTENAKFENFMADSEESYNFKNSMYTNERYRKYINEILPWLYNRGFMEINLSDIDNRIAAADKLKTLQDQQTIKQRENIEQSLNSYPEWVNESLFFDVVRADCENYQEIVQLTVSQATNVGDNYSSILLKIDIDIELTDHTKDSLSYLLKIPPNGDEAKAVITKLDAFKKENIAYFDIIPQLENLYKDKAGLEVTFSPKCFKLNEDKERSDALTLENLQTKNFKNCDRLEGLDMQHIEAVLKKLAQFHAASACLFESEENVPELFKLPRYTEENRSDSEILAKSFMGTFLEGVKQYEGNKDYISKVENFTENALTFLIKASSIDKNKFNVLNHGDCWTNNILFQHDEEGKITNTLFVDFQLVQYGTPCYDLLYFLLSSTKLELKLEYFDYFIRYYYDNLKTNLELLSYSKAIPSLKDVHLDLLDNAVWALYTVVCILPVILLDSKDKPSLEKIVGVNDDCVAFRKQMFSDKIYRSHIETVLPWLNRRGLLDFC